MPEHPSPAFVVMQSSTPTSAVVDTPTPQPPIDASLQQQPQQPQQQLLDSSLLSTHPAPASHSMTDSYVQLPNTSAYVTAVGGQEGGGGGGRGQMETSDDHHSMTAIAANAQQHQQPQQERTMKRIRPAATYRPVDALISSPPEQMMSDSTEAAESSNSSNSSNSSSSIADSSNSGSNGDQSHPKKRNRFAFLTDRLKDAPPPLPSAPSPEAESASAIVNASPSPSPSPSPSLTERPTSPLGSSLLRLVRRRTGEDAVKTAPPTAEDADAEQRPKRPTRNMSSPLSSSRRRSPSSSPPRDSGNGANNKRSIYAQKIMHGFSAMVQTISSAMSRGNQAPLFSSSPHTFTNSPAWILGRCYRLLGPPPPNIAALASPSLQPSAENGASMNSAAAQIVSPSHSASLSLQQRRLSETLQRRYRFFSDYNSKLWFTYRKGFPAIGTSDYCSDAGWGCMIRSAQMMLSQVFIRLFLSRDWRRSDIQPAQLAHARKIRNAQAQLVVADSSSSPLPGPLEYELPPLNPVYLHILSLFLDSPSPSCPYSIHSLLSSGNGKSARNHAGEWFGPHNACWMIKQCMEAELTKLQARIAAGKPVDLFDNTDGAHDYSRSDASNSTASSSSPSNSVRRMPPQYAVPKVYVSDDGTLYLDKLIALASTVDVRGQPEAASNTPASSASSSAPPAQTVASQQTADSSSHPLSLSSSFSAAAAPTGPPVFSPNFHPLVVLIPLRLGTDKLNPSYIPSLLSLFQFPQCIGIIGGKPRSSLYFIGVQDDNLFYLDPHTVQKSCNLTGEYSLKSTADLLTKHEIAATYHCSTVLSIPVHAIDPSLAIGFFLENEESMHGFWDQAKQLAEVQSRADITGAGSSSSNSRLNLLPVFHVAEISPSYDGFMSDDSSDESLDDANGDDSDDIADDASMVSDRVDDADEAAANASDAEEGADREFELARENVREQDDSPAVLPTDASSSVPQDENAPQGSATAANDEHDSSASDTRGRAPSGSALSDWSAAAAKSISEFTTSVAQSAQPLLTNIATTLQESARQAAATIHSQVSSANNNNQQSREPPASSSSSSSAASESYLHVLPSIVRGEGGLTKVMSASTRPVVGRPLSKTTKAAHTPAKPTVAAGAVGGGTPPSSSKLASGADASGNRLTKKASTTKGRRGSKTKEEEDEEDFVVLESPRISNKSRRLAGARVSF